MGRRRPRRDSGFDEDELQLALALSASLAEQLGIPVEESPDAQIPDSPTLTPRRHRLRHSDALSEEVFGGTAATNSFVSEGEFDDEASEFSSGEENYDALAESSEREEESDSVGGRQNRKRGQKGGEPATRKRRKCEDERSYSESTHSPEVKSRKRVSRKSEARERESRERESHNPHSWAAIQAELADDWAEQQKALMRNKVPELVEMSTMPASSDGLGRQWRTPELKVRSLKHYNEKQRDALLVARAFMFQKIQGLSDQWRRSNADVMPDTVGEERCLSGHRVAAAINELKLPIRSEDLTLMLNPESRPPDPAERTQGAQESFEWKFRRLLRDAKWPKDEATSTEKSVVDFRRDQLPAFQPAAPPEFATRITWEQFCRIFDLVNLRCEKSGKVW
eukprot:Gregarina_sp_Poly_1__4059@NODE_222_length_11242_cov_244_139150_g196_i0_p3_GENE_NODE_222_length_11242_cov_244_139150_g196_i0NODE_222_length_11242_cov_244_139150_g196_i0_p3_ORF_typecomplete_len395_score72_82Erf4/PF10256_9/0_19UIM/PF02809_20/1_4_NODE_222_length_11242_cov_244_139150_g196_i049766160